MASNRNLMVTTTFFLIILAAAISASKLNVARVLLPVFDDLTINFTLQSTDDSCFRWSVTRDDIIRLTFVDYKPDLDCAPKAIVSAATREKARMMSDVVAEDTLTRQQLRCVVIVDAISSLAITTTTKELILEEAPEVFEVRAYDNQGNEFSTLTGVPFDWVITPLGPSKDRPVLRFISFQDSSYETPITLLDLEERNERGHKILLEGVKTGISKVSVKLPQLEYVAVKSNEIQLTVIANIHILPQEVYIMVGDVVNFRIIHTSYGKGEEINYKTSQYSLNIVDKLIAEINKNTGTLRAKKKGKTNIVLHDKNIDVIEPGIKLPTAYVYVVEPAYMMITLLPHRNWAAMISEYYDIAIDIYTSDNRKLIIGPGVDVRTEIASPFQVTNSTTNGTYLSGWTREEGVAKIEATLQGIDTISATSEILIYPRIVLIPGEIILPWDEESKPKYDFEIKATGGDSKFLWSSSNHSIGVVTQYGKAHTYYHGQFEITAAMHRNHHNRQTATVKILPPSRLEIVEYVMEAEVGSIVFLHVALYADQSDDNQQLIQMPFTKCQEIPFKVRTSDPKFYYNKGVTVTPVGLACASMAISGQAVGSTKVTVSHAVDGTILQDSVTLHFFKPLILLKPEGAVVLGVGSSANLIFTGGPQTIMGKEPHRIITNSNVAQVSAVDTTKEHNLPGDDEYTIVNVLCKKLGSSEISLSISNAPSLPNCKNQEATQIVRVVCGKPRRIELQPELKVIDARSCPMDFNSERVIVQSNKDIDLLVRVKDDEGRLFLNISSFDFEIDITPRAKGFLSKSQILEVTGSIGSAVYANRSYITIIPQIETGQITVDTAIVGYDKVVLNRNKIAAEYPEFLDDDDLYQDYQTINSTIHLFLVDDTVVTPNSITIYNHPHNRQQLDVRQGSGFYQITMNQEGIANVKYLDKSRQLDVHPISDGTLVVKLVDMCLVSKPAIITINIVSVRSLKVELSDKVELGKCVACIVRLHDEHDNILSLPNMDLIEVNTNIDSDIISVTRNLQSGDEGELHYTINGIKLGDTKIHFFIGEPDYPNYVISSPMTIQVFPPLKVYPRNVTVTVGSQIQYTTKGGPQPSQNLEYTVIHQDLAKISSNGILKGLITGQTRVKARSLGINPTTGQRVIYGEDTVDVNVIKLTSIKIAAPLTRFRIGSTVPLWATGVPDQVSPLILATIEPAISFAWGSQDADIARIKGVAISTGIEYAPTEMLSIRLVGVSPGRTTVYLNATLYKGNRKTTIYASSVDIEIFDELRLIRPINTLSYPILIAPHSTLQLQTNMDNIAELSYTVAGEDAIKSTDVQRTDSSPQQLITVSPNGLIKSFGNVGQTIVLITMHDKLGLTQTLTIPVEVKEVHYMMISINTQWTVNPKYVIRTIPVGSEFELATKFYDNVGNKFAAAAVDLQIRTSRFDLLKINANLDNASYTILTKRPGITVIKIWSDAIEKTADYIKLNVVQNIKPIVEQVTVGDVLCYFTPLLKKKDKGVWVVSDEKLIHMDANTGIAVVSKSNGGQTTISHSLHFGAPISLNINPITEIILEAPPTPLSNAPDTNYHAYVMLIGLNNDNRANNMINGWDCAQQVNTMTIEAPFTCDIRFEDPDMPISPCEVLTVTPQFDSKKGKYYCKITGSPESNKKYNTLSMSIILTVQSGDKTAEAKIPFTSAIYVPADLILDEQSFSGTLTITGLHSVLKNVDAAPVESTVLSIRDRNIEDNKLQYTVYLLDYHRNLEETTNYMNIIVTSPDTRQSIEVHVKVQNPDKFIRECGAYGSSSFLAVLHSNRVYVSVVIAVLLVIAAIIYVYTSYMYPTVNVNVLTTSTPNQSMQQSMHNQSVCPSHVCQSSMAYVSPIKFSANTSTSNSHINSHICSPPECCYCTRSPEIRRNRRYM